MIQLGKSISKRPKYIDFREVFAYWEINNVIGKKKSDQDVLLTMLKRKTRYFKVIKTESKSCKPLNYPLLDFITESRTMAKSVFKSITSDNGSEFAGLNALNSLVSIYLYHTYSSFERYINERHNEILRQFISKGRIINDFSEDKITCYVDLIKAKPSLDKYFRTSADIFSGRGKSVQIDITI